MATIRDQTAGPPIAGPSGRNQNTVPTLDPDPTQDPSGHLGPAFPSGKSHPKHLPYQPDPPSESLISIGHNQPRPPRRNPPRRRLPPERYCNNTTSSHYPAQSARPKPLSAHKRSSAAAHDEMVTIRDRMTRLPTAGPSGRNQYTPSTPDLDPTQDPSGHLGPTVPSGKTHPTPTPHHSQPDNLDGSSVSPGPLGSSASSGKSHLIQDPHRTPPSLVGYPEQQEKDQRVLSATVGAPSNRKPVGDRHGRVDLGVVGRNRLYNESSGSRGASNRKPAGDRHGRTDLGAGRTPRPAETTTTLHRNDPPGAIQRTKKLFEANPGRERPEASCKAPGTSYPTTPNPANQSETDFVSTLAGMARGEPLAPRTPQDRTDNLTGIQPPSPGEHRHHKPKENGQQQTKPLTK
nr:serine/arginine repetitive matrix protein 1-like [Aedes albopictus]